MTSPSNMGGGKLFTPGPWRVEEGTTLVWGACNPDDRSTYGMGYPITQARVRLGSASEYASEFREDEGEANARLIAAAPELYGALEDLAERLIGAFPSIAGTPEAQRAKAALAKARGEQ